MLDSDKSFCSMAWYLAYTSAHQAACQYIQWMSNISTYAGVPGSASPKDIAKPLSTRVKINDLDLEGFAKCRDLIACVGLWREVGV